MDLRYDMLFGLLDKDKNAPEDVKELFRLHPQAAMAALGITYKQAIPETLFDCWRFIGCENVPEQLPPFLHISRCN